MRPRRRVKGMFDPNLVFRPQFQKSLLLAGVDSPGNPTHKK
jgi:hypothetical protein